MDMTAFRGSRNKILALLLICVLATVSCVGVAFAYSSTMTVNGNTVGVDATAVEIFQDGSEITGDLTVANMDSKVVEVDDNTYKAQSSNAWFISKSSGYSVRVPTSTVGENMNLYVSYYIDSDDDKEAIDIEYLTINIYEPDGDLVGTYAILEDRLTTAIPVLSGSLDGTDGCYSFSIFIRWNNLGTYTSQAEAESAIDISNLVLKFYASAA